MTPKEKANDLIDKYKPLCGGYWGGKINKEFAKQSAIITVDEILNNNFGSHTDEMNATNSEIYCDEYFWNDVKSELQSF